MQVSFFLTQSTLSWAQRYAEFLRKDIGTTDILPVLLRGLELLARGLNPWRMSVKNRGIDIDLMLLEESIVNRSGSSGKNGEEIRFL